MSDSRSATRSKTIKRNGLIALGVLLAGIVGTVLFVGSGDAGGAAPTTFPVRKGPLDIIVLEGGNMEALEAQEVKSEVAGWEGTKILFIVEEGTYITEDDVKAKKRLVELDSSSLRDKLTTAEIQFKSTQASVTEARQGYDIQINKSESEIYAAELELKFARLELEKFLGREVTNEILDKILVAEEARRDAEAEVKIDPAADQPEIATALVNEQIASSEGVIVAPPQPAAPQSATPASGEVSPADGQSQPAPASPENESMEPQTQFSLVHLRLGHPKIDFLDFARAEVLGDGEAGQKIRELQDKLYVARKEKALAETELDALKRLFERDFVTQRELDNAQMDVEKQNISVESAETAKDLFLEYEFPKQAEKLTSDFLQAKRKLERTEKQALSELAQAESKLLSAEARYSIEQTRIVEYKTQVDKCVMYAERAGLVVYGGSGNRYWDEEPIKEGATIRERQAIITIPDMTTMAVKIKVHESEVKKVKIGQQARVRVDAFADRVLQGRVQKVAVLPDAENRWMNPDLKVYETVVTVAGVHDWLKPGMSAEVEILVETLPDAMYIPIQSIVPDGKQQVCFVFKNGEVEKRPVETAQTTVEYIVVASGLSEGERVLIRPPDGSRNDQAEEERVPWEEQPAAGEEPAAIDAVEAAAETTTAVEPVREDAAATAVPADAPTQQ